MAYRQPDYGPLAGFACPDSGGRTGRSILLLKRLSEKSKSYLVMKHSAHYPAILAVCCLALLPQQQAHADSVYTWVDNLGVTHFSQTPPPDPGTEPEVIELKPLPPAPPSEYDDYYSVIRQAERMERRRLENEKLEAERLQAEAEALRARAEAKAAMQPADGYTNDTTVYAPVYPYYYYPRHRPGYGNKPHPPGYWPVRPGQRSPYQPGNRPGPPGHPPGRPGFRPTPHRVISAIPAQR